MRKPAETGPARLAGITKARTANVALAVTHAELNSACEQGETVEFG
jgi:hypothetical protein